MKTKSFFAVAILFLTCNAFSQQSSENFLEKDSYLDLRNSEPNKQNNRFSTGFIAGTTTKTNTNGSLSLGLEFTYDISKKFSLVGSYLHNNDHYGDLEKTVHINENDYSAGVRFYANKGKAKFFMESLLDLNIFTSGYNSGYNSPVTAKSLGLAFGIGNVFELTDNFSGILKTSVAKFEEKGFTYGIFGGLRYRF